MSHPTEAKTKSDVQIRFASASDALILARLRYDFRSGIDAPVEEAADFIERCRKWMADRLGEGGPWRCWLAERDNQIVGAVWLQLIDKIPNPAAELEHHAYITNFYVLEDLRGAGIGGGLLSAVLDWCRTASVHAVILWPTPESRTLYERYGFEVPSDLMELSLF